MLAQQTKSRFSQYDNWLWINLNFFLASLLCSFKREVPAFSSCISVNNLEYLVIYLAYSGEPCFTNQLNYKITTRYINSLEWKYMCAIRNGFSCMLPKVKCLKPNISVFPSHSNKFGYKTSCLPTCILLPNHPHISFLLMTQDKCFVFQTLHPNSIQH